MCWFLILNFLISCCWFQEFRGVVGLTESADLESDMTKVPVRTAEILASCHALVFVDNKLVCLCNFWHAVPRIPEFWL